MVKLNHQIKLLLIKGTLSSMHKKVTCKGFHDTQDIFWGHPVFMKIQTLFGREGGEMPLLSVFAKYLKNGLIDLHKTL